MRDISGKPSTHRTARAEALLRARPETIERVRNGSVPKGNVLEAARAAGLLAAKRTPELIPLCHPIPLTHVEVAFEIRPEAIAVTASVSAVWATGVEMEALTAATVAALTLYDMLKPLDDDLEIVHVRLLEKRGGASDRGEAPKRPIRAAVVVISDSVAAGRRKDASGAAIVEILGAHGVAASAPESIPDDQEVIDRTLRRLCDEGACDLVLTTGGTGLGPRDVTVEATRAVIEREAPGIAEAARGFGQAREPKAMFSRGIAGIRGRTLIVNLPGSPKGVRESLAALLPALLHAAAMIAGGGHPE
ncbi:MAG: bifunctional molybdenum cofactor biosynthesis protein MoaC/MoaB [Candidatus Eisenbacteria bacterium]